MIKFIRNGNLNCHMKNFSDCAFSHKTRKPARIALYKQKIMSTKTLFVPGLEPAIKHATIFNEFDKLQTSETLLLVNDHDPKPLYYQLVAERGNIFNWEYVQDGPEQWQVALSKIENLEKETIGTIVGRDIRKADVFKKYGIDFCCGGKKTVQQACTEKGIDAALVEADLRKPVATNGPVFDFAKWDCDFLADYIYNQHHKYFYNEEPVISELVEKVANRHGKETNNLLKIQKIYLSLRSELMDHFAKEEAVLFPLVKFIAQSAKGLTVAQPPYPVSLSHCLQKMEADHEQAGDLLREIESLTDNYTAPEGACNSYKFLYQKLKDLNADLHQHIHLENNVLFPKALQLEQKLYN